MGCSDESCPSNLCRLFPRTQACETDRHFSCWRRYAVYKCTRVGPVVQFIFPYTSRKKSGIRIQVHKSTSMSSHEIAVGGLKTVSESKPPEPSRPESWGLPPNRFPSSSRARGRKGQPQPQPAASTAVHKCTAACSVPSLDICYINLRAARRELGAWSHFGTGVQGTFVYRGITEAGQQQLAGLAGLGILVYGGRLWIPPQIFYQTRDFRLRTVNVISSHLPQGEESEI